MQVRNLGRQVRFGERQPRIRLLQVDTAADARLEARLDLDRSVLVLNVVVFGQLNEPAETLNVVVGACGFERSLLGDVEQLEIA